MTLWLIVRFWLRWQWSFFTLSVIFHTQLTVRVHYPALSEALFYLIWLSSIIIGVGKVVRYDFVAFLSIIQTFFHWFVSFGSLFFTSLWWFGWFLITLLKVFQCSVDKLNQVATFPCSLHCCHFFNATSPSHLPSPVVTVESSDFDNLWYGSFVTSHFLTVIWLTTKDFVHASWNQMMMTFVNLLFILVAFCLIGPGIYNFESFAVMCDIVILVTTFHV